MATEDACQQCGEPLEVLRHPLRRLRWTRYWWHGLASLVSQPLKVCATCGNIYTFSGRFVAAGVAETAAEMKAQGFRDDMANLRDGFATVVIASQIALVWTLAGPGSFEPTVSVLSAVVGGAALLPFVYFAKKTRQAKKELKRLRMARQQGELLR